MSFLEEPIVFGLIGCGKIGEVHANQMAAKGTLAAVCDSNELRALDFSRRFGVPAYFDYQIMLAKQTNLNVVAVCTPNGMHANQTVDCLRTGANVLCEKPMALTTKDCLRMINEATLVQKQLFVVKQNRFNPPVMRVKRAIDEGYFGKIYSAQLNCFWNRDDQYYNHPWHGSATMDGGILFTQFSHFIDLLYWFLGDLQDVKAYSQNFNHNGVIAFEDTGVAVIRFKSGALATLNYTINSFGQNMEGSLTLFGEKGTVKIGGQYLNTLEYQQFENFYLEGLEVSRPANNYGRYQGSMSNHDKVYDNIIDVLTNGAVAYTTANDSMKTVEMIEKICANTQFNNVEG